MKVIITESQLEELMALVKNRYDNNKVANVTKNQTHWFDYFGPSLQQYSKVDIDRSLKYTMDWLKDRYKLKRVVAKDNNKDVGFFVWSKTTPDKEEWIPGDTTEYDVILATAIDPKYRGQGLLKNMIQKSGVQKPFLVQTSDLSTPEVWSKIGCTPVMKYKDGQGTLEKCG